MQTTWPIWLNQEQRIPGRALTVSLICHALIFSTALLQLDSWAPGQASTERRKNVTHLFLPAKVDRKQAVTRTVRTTRLDGATPQPRHSDRQDAPTFTGEPRVNLNAIELSFEDDALNALPEIVRSYNGVFALTDKHDPSFTRYVLEPPDWTVRSVTLEISSHFRLKLSPAEKWVVLREAASRYSLDLNDYDVSALFERAYANCLQQAIRARAMAGEGGPHLRVMSARLAFSAGKACGVEVVAIATSSTP